MKRNAALRSIVPAGDRTATIDHQKPAERRSIASCPKAIALLAAVVICIAPRAATAQPAEPFYKGKTITIVIGSPPGGGYDFYGRLIARHLGRNLAGNPAIIAQNMPGAGSLLAANHIYAVAPRDGTRLGVVGQTIAHEEAEGNPGVKYKSNEFNWIGRATSVLEVAVSGPLSRTRTIQDAMARETPFAGTGAGSLSELYPKLLNALAGTKFKVISGYQGSAPAMRAIESGEVDAAGNSWTSLMLTRRPMIEQKQIAVLVQYMAERSAELPDTPTVVEIARTEAGRQILAFYASSAEIGRAMLAPPGLPPERVHELRRAFDAMLKDPQFLVEIEKTRAEFHPASGEAVQKLIETATKVPKPLVDQISAILRTN